MSQLTSPVAPLNDEDVRSMNHATDHAEGSAERHEGAEHGEPEHDHEKPQPRLPFAHLSAAAMAKWKRETRYGIAALLSFVILVSVLIMNKGHWTTSKNDTKKSDTRSSVALAIAPSASEKPKDGQPGKAPTSETKDQKPPGSPPAPAEPGKPETKTATEEQPPAATENVKLTGATENDQVTLPLPEKPPAKAAEGPPPNSTDDPPANAPGAPPAANAQEAPPAALPPAADVPPAKDQNDSATQHAAPLEPVKESPAGSPAQSQPTAPANSAPEPTPVSEAATPEPTLPKPKADDPPAATTPFPSAPVEPQAPPKPAAPEPATPTSPPGPAPAQEKPTELPNLAPSPATSDQPPSTENLPPPPRSTDSGSWQSLPSIRKGQGSDDDPAPRAIAAAGLPAVQGNARQTVESDQVEPIPHVVERGENFWTISKLHYSSGRYYKALWKANSDQVSAPDKLVVGMTIRIPPPELLDRSLIEPPRVNRAPSTIGTTVRRSSQVGSGSGRAGASAKRASEVELALPVADPLVDRKPKHTLAPDSPPETRLRPRRVVHKVLPHETLRSIARDTLGDSHRFDEILELNRDVIDDPYNLPPGQILELPEDAKVGRRGQASSR